MRSPSGADLLRGDRQSCRLLRRTVLWHIAWMAGIACCLGCGSNKPKTTPVSGMVTYKGAAVSAGIVRFNPADPKKGRVAEGKLDSSGNFKLSTFHPGDGALPGDYHVTILPSVADPNALAKDVVPKEKSAPPFPEKYGDAKTSGFKETIKGGEPRSNVKLELKE